MHPVSHQRHHSELELDESELFEAGSNAGSPSLEEATEPAVQQLALEGSASADESDSDDDGIVLDSEGGSSSSSSESEVDEVEMGLRGRISSLHSSLDGSAGAPIHAGERMVEARGGCSAQMMVLLLWLLQFCTQ